MLLLPLICHKPDIPGRMRLYSSNTVPYFETSASTMGRGPVRLISPRNTFHSCGSSSKLVLRKKRPVLVMRGSSRNFWLLSHSARDRGFFRKYCSSTRSASTCIVRNFQQRKCLPSTPIRVCP